MPRAAFVNDREQDDWKDDDRLMVGNEPPETTAMESALFGQKRDAAQPLTAAGMVTGLARINAIVEPERRRAERDVA
jgi:hypothetical protein